MYVMYVLSIVNGKRIYIYKHNILFYTEKSLSLSLSQCIVYII